MNTKTVIVSFLSGAVVGSVAALLFAPLKGEHLRGEIRRRASSAVDDVNEYLRDAAAKTSEVVRRLSKKTANAA